jgi:anti-sigma regulatory factor (Ser/Thr protein kinase)
MSTPDRRVFLKARLEASFLPLVLAFAEESVKALGFGHLEADRIRLATEELFLYLCDTAPADSDLEIEVKSGIYYVKARFLFPSVQFDPHALNLTAHATPDDEDVKNLGLLIASRSVDYFYIQHDRREGLGFTLVKEKTYPEVPADPLFPGTPTALDNIVLAMSDSALTKSFVKNAAGKYEDTLFPAPCRHPAKMADMITSGDYRLVVATGKGRQALEIGGGLLWRNVGKSMIEFLGPYVFDTKQGEAIAVGLIDYFLGEVAKSRATFVMGRHATESLPRDYFELLGTVSYTIPEKGLRESPFFYRQLHEDPGSQVWAHPDLAPFLRERYRRLLLPREVLPLEWEGERRHPHSAFTVRFDRTRGIARLRPVWDGADAVRILADHKEVLSGEGFGNLFFEMDLGQPWQGLLTPALLENRFEPVIVLPGAGQGDVVLFQCR